MATSVVGAHCGAWAWLDVRWFWENRGQRLSGQDIPAVASALTWLGERLYYLAATNTPPFDNQDTLVDTLVDTLLHLWTSALYES